MIAEQWCVITFFTIYHALKAEKVLQSEGININLIPVPREISSDCGVALQFDYREKEKVKEILENNLVKIDSFYYFNEGGKNEGS